MNWDDLPGVTYRNSGDICTICGKRGGQHFSYTSVSNPSLGCRSFCDKEEFRREHGWRSFSYLDPEYAMDEGL